MRQINSFSNEFFCLLIGFFLVLHASHAKAELVPVVWSLYNQSVGDHPTPAAACAAGPDTTSGIARNCRPFPNNETLTWCSCKCDDNPNPDADCAEALNKCPSGSTQKNDANGLACVNDEPDPEQPPDGDCGQGQPIFPMMGVMTHRFPLIHAASMDADLNYRYDKISGGSWAIGENRHLEISVLSGVSKEMLVRRNDGKAYRFFNQGRTYSMMQSGVSLYWSSYNTTPIQVQEMADGFLVTAPDSSIEKYDTSGILESITSANGYLISIDYTYSGSTLTGYTMTDEVSGSSIEYTVNGSGQVTDIDLIGTNFSYTLTYNGNDMLSSITDQDSNQKEFFYSWATDNTALTSAEDETGSTYLEWEYELDATSGFKLPVMTSVGSGSESSEEYNIEYTIQQDNGVYVITDADVYFGPGGVTSGAKKSYVYEKNSNGLRRVKSIDGAAIGSCQASNLDKTYDANNFVRTTTYSEGNVVHTEYDSKRGVLLLEGSGLYKVSTTTKMDGKSRMIKTTWHAEKEFPLSIQRYRRSADSVLTWSTAASNWTLYQTEQYVYDDKAAGGSGTDCTNDSTGSEKATWQICEVSIKDEINNVTRTWDYNYTLQTATGKEMLVDTKTIDGPLSGSGDSTTYNFNSSGQLTSMVLPTVNSIAQTTSYSDYNEFGLPETITDPNGIVSSVVYDARGRVTSITADDGGIEAITALTYYPNGLLETVTQPDGSSLEYFYNSAHQLISIENNFGEHIDFTPSVLNGQWTLSKTYKAAGTSSSDLVAQYERVFDALGRLSKIKDASGTEKQVLGYDTNNNLTTRTMRGDTTNSIPYDENDLATVHEYDALDRLIRSVGSFDCGGACSLNTYNNYSGTVSSSPETEYEYNGQGLVSKVTNANGHYTTFSYNGFGELVQESSLDRGTTTYQYDAAGNLTQKVKGYGTADEQVIAYSWDNLNRLTAVNYPGTDQDIAYSYDAAASGESCGENVGRLCRVVRGAATTGHVTDYSYNTLGRITAEKVRPAGTNGFALTTGYSYNNAGALTGITLPGGRTVAISRSNGRIGEVNSSFGATPIEHLLADNVGYQAFGGVLVYDMPTNNENDTLRYQQNQDADGRLTNWQFMKVGDDPLSMNYHYDAFGNVSEIEDLASYSYDAQQRLVAAMGPYGLYSYQYDAVGNRTQMQKQAYTGTGSGITLEDRWIEDYQYATGSNRLETIDRYTGSTVTGTPYRTREFTYDGRGNIKTDERTEGTTTTLELEYGNGDRLNSVDVQ